MWTGEYNQNNMEKAKGKQGMLMQREPRGGGGGGGGVAARARQNGQALCLAICLLTFGHAAVSVQFSSACGAQRATRYTPWGRQKVAASAWKGDEGGRGDIICYVIQERPFKGATRCHRAMHAARS